MMFNFDTTIDPKVGFSAFSVEYTSTPGGPVTKADNGGAGFPFSDVVMLQPSASCTSDGMIKAVAAVRPFSSPLLGLSLRARAHRRLFSRPGPQRPAHHGSLHRLHLRRDAARNRHA